MRHTSGVKRDAAEQVVVLQGEKSGFGPSCLLGRDSRSERGQVRRGHCARHDGGRSVMMRIPDVGGGVEGGEGFAFGGAH